MAMNAAGDLFIADSDGRRIRKVSPSGTISTVAGNGTIACGPIGGHNFAWAWATGRLAGIGAASTYMT